MRHIRFALSVLALLLLSATSPALCADDSVEQVRDLMMHLQQALNAGKADQAAAFFTDGAILVDQAGEVLSGRAAIQERFQHLHSAPDGTEVGIFGDTIQSVAPDAIVVVGSLTQKEGTSILPVSRVSATLVQQGGKWLIANVAETALQSSASDNMRALDWLIGSWQSGTNRTMKAEWGAGRNSIRVHFGGSTTEMDSCRISWDPSTKSIISFQFDSDGGFGHSYWAKNAAKKWIIDSSGIAATGERTRALGMLEQTSPDEFVWQASSTSIGALGPAEKGISTWKRVSE